MKNKLFLLLIMLFSVVLVGCSQTTNVENSMPETDEEMEVEQSEVTHEELFDEVMSEAVAPTSAHLKMYSESETIFEDSSVVINTEHEIKYDKREENNMKYHGITTSTTEDFMDGAVIEMYYLDNYFYTKIGDIKTKTKIEEDVLFQTVDYASASFKAEDLLDFSFEEKDEYDVFTYAINEDSLAQHIAEIEQMHNIAEGVEFITARGETVITKDGEIIESDITIEVKVDTPAFSATIITNTYTEYYSINEDIEITYPEDLQSYIEI